MLNLLLRPLRILAQALVGNDSPRQTAWGFALGMVVGGFWAAREAELDRIIARCLFTSAVLLFAVGQGWVPALPGRLGAGWAAFAMVALAGVGVGMAGPSRDMLIKRAAPPGATGRRGEALDQVAGKHRHRQGDQAGRQEQEDEARDPFGHGPKLMRRHS